MFTSKLRFQTTGATIKTICITMSKKNRHPLKSTMINTQTKTTKIRTKIMLTCLTKVQRCKWEKCHHTNSTIPSNRPNIVTSHNPQTSSSHIVHRKTYIGTHPYSLSYRLRHNSSFSCVSFNYSSFNNDNNND